MSVRRPHITKAQRRAGLAALQTELSNQIVKAYVVRQDTQFQFVAHALGGDAESYQVLDTASGWLRALKEELPQCVSCGAELRSSPLALFIAFRAGGSQQAICGGTCDTCTTAYSDDQIIDRALDALRGLLGPVRRLDAAALSRPGHA